MRTLVHTATMLAILLWCTSPALAQEAGTVMPLPAPAQAQPVADKAATTAVPAVPTPVDGQVQPNAAVPQAATPAPGGQPDDEAQPSEEDNTQSSGPMTATDKIVAHFMDLDTDKSDGVSFDEYMAMVQQRATDRFAAMDANGDGQVTAEEYRKFWKEREAQWYRLRR